ncbi:MAG: copper resistance protein NlpE [Tannerellaceae bacterium]|nr:copper resistance protein NlpE [Tannerellaceae bacterium]
MVKKYSILLLVFLFCIACHKKNRYVTDGITFPVEAVYLEDVPFDTTPINIMDSLHYDAALGEVIEYEYEDILPAADGPGIQYDLTLWAQARSKEGVFLCLLLTWKIAMENPIHIQL